MHVDMHGVQGGAVFSATDKEVVVLQKLQVHFTAVHALMDGVNVDGDAKRVVRCAVTREASHLHRLGRLQSCAA